jgi:hypothetical protein
MSALIFLADLTRTRRRNGADLATPPADRGGSLSGRIPGPDPAPPGRSASPSTAAPGDRRPVADTPRPILRRPRRLRSDGVLGLRWLS